MPTLAKTITLCSLLATASALGPQSTVSSRMDQVSMERHQERGILNAIRRLNDSSTPKLKIQPTFLWLSK
jgi:hypothetical protein